MVIVKPYFSFLLGGGLTETCSRENLIFLVQIFHLFIFNSELIINDICQKYFKCLKICYHSKNVGSERCFKEKLLHLFMKDALN